MWTSLLVKLKSQRMTRAKKFLLAVLSIALLSQIPFAYRRYRLGRLNAAIQLINSSRKAPETHDRFAEYKGVVHVHSFLGGHSTGTFSEIIAAAQENGLQFVIMTEHPEKEIDTSEMTLKGTHGGVLFLNGNEVSTLNGDRLLVIPGEASLSRAGSISDAEVAANAKALGSLTIIAYPEDFKSWGGNLYDGIEVYNVFTNARTINPLIAFFDALWSHYSYPDLLFANYFRRPGESLKKWDQALARQRLSATAGNDAHANVGMSLNDSSGKRLLGLNLDPYETSFHLVRLHVLVPRDEPLSATNLMEAIRAGHCFIGFDLFGDTTGFRLEAENSTDTRVQGDEITFEKETRLRVSTPVLSRLLIFKDGVIIMDEKEVTSKEIKLTESGVYRVEVYLSQLGKPAGEQPWIISNPIYVR
jgi:hypothetical protein